MSSTMIQELLVEKLIAIDGWELIWEGNRVEPSKGAHSCVLFQVQEYWFISHLFGQFSQCVDEVDDHNGSGDMALEKTIIEAFSEEWEIKWKDINLKEKTGSSLQQYHSCNLNNSMHD